MPSTTSNDGALLYLSVMEVVENFGLKENIVGIASDSGGNIWVFREALESNKPMTLFFPTQSPIHYGVPFTYIGRGLQGGSVINQVG